MGQTSAEQALRALEPLVGEWTDARTIAGRWEKAENGPEFTVDFYLTYRKVVPT